MIRLILGGEKSGKSDLALSFLAKDPEPGLFVATGKAADFGFRERILAHRRERDAGIPVAEAGVDLAGLLASQMPHCGCVLVDSLDFWLFACMREEKGGEFAEKLMELLASPCACVVTLVSCEVGLGPVAATRETREFVRRQGALNRRLAALADEVWLSIAGLPLKLK